MKTKLTYSITAALMLLGATMVGCSSSGGSGDSSDSVSASLVTQEGTFVDGPVDGLSYTGRLSGTTKDGGHYSFQGTDLKVEFGLGDKLKLGALTPSTSPASVLDLFDPVKSIDVLSGDTPDQAVVNLLVLLQSLDSDGNASNGINIPHATIVELERILSEDPYNITDLSTYDFRALSTGDLADLLALVIAATPNADVVVDPNDAIIHFTETVYGLQPPVTDINGSLVCTDPTSFFSSDAGDFNASQTLKRNVSSKSPDDPNKRNPTSHNTIERLSMTVPAQSSDGVLLGGDVYPILINYTQQVVGGYETGDGSADIGDPAHVDGVFLALSLDDGLTWKNTIISDTSEKSSINVNWNGETTPYPGHAQKPTMAIEGNNILVAWNDKYCPSNNPFDFVADGTGKYPDDFFAVNGPQGFVDYAGLQAPNDKLVYEVPFSCVWTARGIISTVDNNTSITWHTPMQLTTGSRDSNHIWIESSEAGYAMAWQEDTEGLRSGKGEGPGEGWSGATTNHGSDIWYTSIKMEDFTAAVESDDDTKLKSVNNFHYPVRITDNQSCSNDDTKVYCESLCAPIEDGGYGFETIITSNHAQTEITRCNTYDLDMLIDDVVVLDGDTGASRPALKILNTTEGHVVILGYEETKGMSDSTPGEGDMDQSDGETIIALEGKSVYFESFMFNAIDDFNVTADDFDSSDLNTTILNVAMPLVSAGNIVNVKVPDQNTSEMIYENARRLVIGTQIDSCDAQGLDDRTFAFMYKQSFDTQGASSDMFIRVNDGFMYDSFIALDDRNVTNISAQPIFDQTLGLDDYTIEEWTIDNLTDNTYDNSHENTFSPRIFLRGNDVYTGFEYTPNEAKTTAENMPSNFHTHIYSNGIWLGPQNVTQVTKGGTNTVDARFFTTPKGENSNPDVLFVTWGEIDWYDETKAERAESNLYYKRALFDGITWNWDTNTSMLATRDGAIVQEKEVESFATPDGKTIYNVWIQETEFKDYNESDPFTGLDSWFGRIDYNISITPTP